MKIMIRLMGYGISPLGIRGEVELKENSDVKTALETYLQDVDPEGKYSGFVPRVIILNDSLAESTTLLKDQDSLVFINLLAGG